jgi:hypothetical protein
LASFPFHPLEDHFFGTKIGKVWKQFGSINELQEALNSNLKQNEENFICSSKGDKMLYLDLYPTKFRKFIQAENFEALNIEFENLLLEKNPKLDIVFDLLEWLFMGFDLDKNFNQLLNLVSNKKLEFSDLFLEKLREEYKEENLE